MDTKRTAMFGLLLVISWLSYLMLIAWLIYQVGNVKRIMVKEVSNGIEETAYGGKSETRHSPQNIRIEPKAI